MRLIKSRLALLMGLAALFVSIAVTMCLIAPEDAYARGNQRGDAPSASELARPDVEIPSPGGSTQEGVALAIRDSETGEILYYITPGDDRESGEEPSGNGAESESALSAADTDSSETSGSPGTTSAESSSALGSSVMYGLSGVPRIAGAGPDNDPSENYEGDSPSPESALMVLCISAILIGWFLFRRHKRRADRGR